MYEEYYGLGAEPFRLSPDHRFCYDHKGFSKAMAYMEYAFRRAEGFVMITGQPGTGKTTLVGQLVDTLSDANVHTANLVCTQLQADDLLKVVAYSFGIDQSVVEKGELIQHLVVLFNRWHREGQRALLIVDEAQDLSATAVEELRLLTNIQAEGKPLVQVFLLGQPELRELILTPAMEQVHQRIVAASHLGSLAGDETEQYILHRLGKVGWRGNPAISKSVYPLIHKFSDGVPRRINLICSRLFLHGSVEQRDRLGVRDVEEVIRELQAEQLAVGTTFDRADFEVDDVYEPVPAPQAAASDSEVVSLPLPDTAGDALKKKAAVEPVSAPQPVAESPGPAPRTREHSDQSYSLAGPEVMQGASRSLPRRRSRTGWLLLVALLLGAGGAALYTGLAADVGGMLRSGPPAANEPVAAPFSPRAEPEPAVPVATPEVTAEVAAEPDTPMPDAAIRGEPDSQPVAALAERENDGSAPGPDDNEQVVYLVPFLFDSDSITVRASEMLDDAAARFGAAGGGTLLVEGRADSQGPSQYNLWLSRRRAQAVSRYLVRAGVPEASQQVSWVGNGFENETPGAGDDDAGQGRVVRVVWQGDIANNGETE